MDVYLIPVGPLGSDRYELYCEHLAQEGTLSSEPPAGSGRFAAILHRMKAALARVEQEQQSGVAEIPHHRANWLERMKQRALCWIAERMAEWRLLWKLRKESEATLFFPDDVTGDEALAASHRMLKREADRHLKWSIIDGILFCLSGIVAILPGPNPLAYYFGFRFVGHFLSRRGAKHGLEHVRWRSEPSAPLSQLRQAARLAGSDRDRHVRDVASALHLEHLATFFERTAVPAA